MKKVAAILFFFLLMAATVLAQTIKGTYAIKNVQNGMLLRIKDANGKNGTSLVAYNPQEWKCMTWDFKHTGGNTYQLQNLFTHKTFQPQGKALANVAFEQQPLAENATNQLYEFEPVGKDTYMIKLKGTDLYLTPADKDGETNSAIILAPKTAARYQQWSIYEQHPTM